MRISIDLGDYRQAFRAYTKKDILDQIEYYLDEHRSVWCETFANTQLVCVRQMHPNYAVELISKARSIHDPLDTDIIGLITSVCDEGQVIPEEWIISPDGEEIQ